MSITSLDKRARRIALAEMIKACAIEIQADDETTRGREIYGAANRLVEYERDQMAHTLNRMGSFVLVAEPEKSDVTPG